MTVVTRHHIPITITALRYSLSPELGILASIGQGSLGAVTDCAVAGFRRGVCLLSERRQWVLPGVPHPATYPNRSFSKTRGWSSDTVAAVAAAS